MDKKNFLLNFEFINRNDYLFFALLFSIILFKTFPYNWTGNEYAYYGLSHYAFKPEIFNEFYTSHHETNYRAMFTYVVGFFIHTFGYDNVWFVSRILMAGLYSIAILFLLRTFNLQPLSAVLSSILFLILGEGYFAGFNLFNSFRPAIISYILVLFSFCFIERKNFNISLILMILATYIHFQIGLFWSAFIIFYDFLNRKNIKSSFLYLLFIALFTFPIIYELFSSNYQSGSNINYLEFNKGLTERNAHHTRPFNESGQLTENWLYGTIFITFNLIILSVIKFFTKNKDIFLTSIIILNFYLLAMLFAVYFDSNLSLTKFFVFRPDSLIFFLTLLFLCNFFFSRYLLFNVYSKCITLLSIFLITSIPYLFGIKYNIFNAVKIISYKIHLYKNVNIKISNRLEPHEKQLLLWIKENTNEDDVIMFERGRNYLNKKYPNGEPVGSILISSGWEVISKRAAYVNYKNSGTSIPEFMQWRKRMEEKNGIYNGKCSILKNIPVNYIVTFNEVSKNNITKCSVPIVNFENYSIFMVSK